MTGNLPKALTFRSSPATSPFTLGFGLHIDTVQQAVLHSFRTVSVCQEFPTDLYQCSLLYPTCNSCIPSLFNMSRAFDIATPFGRPITTSRVFRDGNTTVTETVTSSRSSRPSLYESLGPVSRSEYISTPPSSRVSSSNAGRAGAGVVTSSSEYERGPDGRPSHFSSTVYKSPYGKTYRFTSHY